MCSRVKYFCWFYSSPKKLLEIKTLSISAGSFTVLAAISETTAMSKWLPIPQVISLFSSELVMLFIKNRVGRLLVALRTV